MRLSSDQRSLAGAPAVLSWQPLDGDGLPRSISGAVTLTVSSSAGTALVSDVAATGAGATARTYTLAATHTAQVDRLTAVWSVDDVATATTHVDIVGAFYASWPAIARRYGGALDASTWSPEQRASARNAGEDRFEAELAYSCRRQFREELIPVRSHCRLLLDEFEPRQVLWATLIDHAGTETALTPTELAALELASAGWVDRVDGGSWGCGSVRIGYVHGLDAPPADLADAFATYVMHVMTRQRSTIPARATSFTTAEASYTLSAPGSERRPTGIDEVDEALIAHRRHRVGIA